MNSEITIGGSEGEGGGQMIRSSMSLAAITQTPVKLLNIRAGRSNPGLKRQHLTAVRAVAEICAGELSGDEMGALSLQFVPGAIVPGNYHFRVGSAGSAMLVLQTVLPPLLTASATSHLVIEGGTHNQWAPPFDFIAKAFLPLINHMGPEVTVQLEQHGFFPAGGGRVIVDVRPSKLMAGFELLESGHTLSRRVTAIVSGLPKHVGEREVSQALRKLNWRLEEGDVLNVNSNGPGNAVLAEISCENITELFTAFGRQGQKAEKVADEVVRDVRRWLKAEAPVGEHLADQILLPLGLSAAQPADCSVLRGGCFRTSQLSQHARTQMDLIKRFLNIDIDVDENTGIVSVAPAH